MKKVAEWKGVVATTEKVVGKVSPWKWIGIGGAVLGGLILLAPKKK